MKTIRLNALELGIAAMMAAMRQGANEIAGIVNHERVENSRPNFEANLLAAKSEVAFGRLYNVCPDMTFRPRAGGPDFHVKGKKVDVKATEHENGRLICLPNRKEKSDLYVLAIVQGDLVTFHGYATKDELLTDTTLTTLVKGGPITHAIPQDALHPLKEVQP